MKPYAKLTSRGQVRRLRVLAEDALRAYGLADATFTQLRHWQNTTFRVDLPAESGPWSFADHAIPGRYLLRLHRPAERTEAQIASELAWLAALHKTGLVVVPEPVLTPQGRSAFVVSNADYPELGGNPSDDRVCSLLRWMPGRILTHRSRTPAHMRLVGQTMAHLHNHVATWKAADRQTRWRWDVNVIMGHDIVSGISPDVWDELPKAECRLHTECEARLRQAVDYLGEGPDVFGLIHGDLHFANILFANGVARPIDFDDCAFSHHLYDMASTLVGFDVKANQTEWRDALVEGYRRVRPISDDMLRWLDVFIAARESSLILWCRSSARTNPKFAAALPAWRDRALPEIRRRLKS